MFSPRSLITPRVRRLAEGLFLLGLLIPFTVAIASLSGLGHRWVDVFTHFVAPVLSGTVAVAILFALLRLRRAAVGGAAVCVLLLTALTPLLAPGGPRPAADGETIRLYVANLYAMNDDVDAMRASIEAADADILVLVEFGDAPAAVAEDLLAGHPYRQVTQRVVRSRDAVRSVIASRHPLSPRAAEDAGRQMAAAVIDTPIGPIHVVGAHLTRPWPFQFQWAQLIQGQNLISHIRNVPEPVVIAGDFNSVAASRLGRLLRSEGGLVHAPGWPGTWPAALPGPLRMTIDQVYHSPALAVTSRRLGRSTGSDHRPVIVELARSDARGQGPVHQASPRPPG